MKQEITLRIILESPPSGVDYGIQKGSGPVYETLQKQRSVNENLRFEFTIHLKTDKAGLPDFAGPVVQGPAGGRFVYVDIGTYAGQTGTIFAGRLKVPLRGITQEMIGQLLAGPGNILTTTVPGTGKNGSPNYGTVKPFDGWSIGK
jgi:hypothetical protein